MTKKSMRKQKAVDGDGEPQPPPQADKFKTRVLAVARQFFDNGGLVSDVVMAVLLCSRPGAGLQSLANLCSTLATIMQVFAETAMRVLEQYIRVRGISKFSAVKK